VQIGQHHRAMLRYQSDRRRSPFIPARMKLF
jgi:hypothetical protein